MCVQSYLGEFASESDAARERQVTCGSCKVVVVVVVTSVDRSRFETASSLAYSFESTRELP